MSLKKLQRLRLIVHLVLISVLAVSVAKANASEVPAPKKYSPRIFVIQNENYLRHREWTPEVSRGYARLKVFEYNWDIEHYDCLVELWERESNWNHLAKNPKSSAFGIPQMLKMNPSTPPDKQIQLGLKYIEHRYDNPCNALRFHDRKNWY